MSARETHTTKSHRPARTQSIAGIIRQRIESGGEKFWTLADFPGPPATAVAQALSRLTRLGELQRVSKGLYYRSRDTVIGKSRPSRDAILARRLKYPLKPAGLTAANFLAFSTQNPALREFATTVNAVSFADDTIHVTTRRPESWEDLSSEEAALLDFLRGRGRHSELSPERTKERLIKLLSVPGRFERLVAAAPTEPPRVRAILGAVGQEMGVSPDILSMLRNHLNPLSQFDFGAFRVLKHAREWQAK
jgi:hypothetical protein